MSAVKGSRYQVILTFNSIADVAIVRRAVQRSIATLFGTNGQGEIVSLIKLGDAKAKGE